MNGFDSALSRLAHRKAAAFAAAGFVALIAIVLIGMMRRPDEAKPLPRTPAQAAPVAVAPTVTKEQALDVAAKTFTQAPPKEATRDEVFALIREAAAGHKARDAARFDAALAKLKSFGAGIQRWLAEGVLTLSDENEAYVSAVALFEVATAECAPFALALVKTDRPAAVLAIGIQLLTKFQVAEAAPVLEELLFRGGEQTLRTLALAYFTAMGDVRMLAKVTATLPELRRQAAQGLAAIRTPEAGTALFEAWKTLFDGASQQSATSNYFLLEALASFDPSFLRGIYEEALRSETNRSRLNVLLSALAKADRAFAMEQVRTVLAGDFPKSVRGQALLVLGAMGGRDAQELLLDLLAHPRTSKDFLDCANGLLTQETLEVAFESVTGLYSSSQDPLARAVLANLLAKYPERLAQDRAFAMSLLGDAAREVEATDPARRALGVQLSAALADFTPDAGAHLAALYEKLKPEERDASATVFAEMAKRGDDARLRPVLETTLVDETAGPHRRVMAADALLQRSGRDAVYAAIEKTGDAQAAAMLGGLILSREGADGAKRLSEIAKATGDDTKRRVIEEQIKAFELH